MKDNFCIVREHPMLINYIDMLQKKNAEALSFYPRQVFEREYEKHRLFLGLLNGEPCGYLYVGAPSLDIKCHQVCIQYDVRRKLYGASLVIAMEEYAVKNNAYTLTLRCGFDLDANKFWDELGYRCIRIVEGGIRRNRKINVWQKVLNKELFEFPSLEPAIGKTSASFWAKHKKTGIVSQFNRGRTLKEYKLIINDKEPST